MLTKAQIESFHDQGYLVVDNAVELSLMRPLREAAARATAKARAGQWSHIRGTGDGDIWGVHHLLHPELGEPVFAEYMASAPVLEVAADLIGEDLRLELVNMLVNPANNDYEIGWHRDLVREDLPPDTELAALQTCLDGVQWNTALHDEACLIIVPASHRRAKTPEEREIVFQRPNDPMPNQLAVQLRAGQGVYYDSQLLHRGVYRKGSQRETLHACLSAARADVTLRKPYIGAPLEWMKSPNFRESLPTRLRPLYDNWVAAMGM